MKNIVIDKPERIDEDIEKFKIDAVEDERNFTSARIRVCREPATQSPMIFYSQELNRNFKNPTDPMAVRHVIKSFSPMNAAASADTALEFKFNDATLAHHPMIDEYSPLSDIHSETMNLFIDEESAIYLSDVGVNIDKASGEFQEIESVDATPFMQEVAGDASMIKRQLLEVETAFSDVKRRMQMELGIVEHGASDEEFDIWLSQHSFPSELVQQYLIHREKRDELRLQLDQASSAVFSETRSMIKLPARIHLTGL